jgi:hypothetical protein
LSTRWEAKTRKKHRNENNRQRSNFSACAAAPEENLRAKTEARYGPSKKAHRTESFYAAYAGFHGSENPFFRWGELIIWIFSLEAGAA